MASEEYRRSNFLSFNVGFMPVNCSETFLVLGSRESGGEE